MTWPVAAARTDGAGVTIEATPPSTAVRIVDTYPIVRGFRSRLMRAIPRPAPAGLWGGRTRGRRGVTRWAGRYAEGGRAEGGRYAVGGALRGRRTRGGRALR